VADDWSAHEKLADTPQGGRSTPWCWTSTSADAANPQAAHIVIFARAKGYTRPLTAAELEMMNLTGDGTGLDMVTMRRRCASRCRRDFFQRGGYERNPVAIPPQHGGAAAGGDECADGRKSNNAGAKELSASY